MDSIEILKIILPIVAIVASFSAIVYSIKNTKKQIRIGRLEEILETLNLLQGIYSNIYWLSVDMKRNEKYINSNTTSKEWEICKAGINKFFEENDKEMLRTRIARLYILTNAYLPNNKLKFKILSINHLYAILLSSLHYKDFVNQSSSPVTIIPKRNKVYEIFREVEVGIIKEMQLGYNSISSEEYNSIFEKDFKKNFGLE